MTYAIFSIWIEDFTVPAFLVLSFSPYFQTSESSSYSMLCLVLVGRVIDGTSPPPIWSYQTLAISIRRFFVAISLSFISDIQINLHFQILRNTLHLDKPSAFSAVDNFESLTGCKCELPEFCILTIHLGYKGRRNVCIICTVS